MYSAEEKKAIAGTLLNQIGNKALVMIGAKNFGYATDKKENVYVSFRVGRNVPRIAFVKITYNAGTDLYDIEYLDREGRIMDSDENFYGDQLATALGHHLKMAVSLGGTAKESTIKELIATIEEMTNDNAHTHAVIALAKFLKNTHSIKILSLFTQLHELYQSMPSQLIELRDYELKRLLKQVETEYGKELSERIHAAY